MEKYIYFFESLSIWIGRAFGWCILVLTLSVTYEVFVRYVLNAPTVWAFDMMVQMYGGLFLMAGAVCTSTRCSCKRRCFIQTVSI